MRIREEMKKKNAQTETQKKSGIFNKGIGKLKNLVQSKESKFNDEIVKHSNLIFSELSRYMTFMCNFYVPYDKANKLLLHFCDYYQMDQSKMHILLTELMSN